MNALRNAGATVEHTFVIFYYDIFRDTHDKLQANGITLHYLTTWWDVLAECKKMDNYCEKTLKSVEDFLDDPCGWSQVHGGK